MNSLILVLVAAVASLVHAAPSHYSAPTPKWHGPLAAPVVLPSGYLADTPEVAALKASRSAALGAVPVSYGPDNGYAPASSDQPKWHGPLAAPVVLPSGYLADTPEVASLKAAHSTALGAAPVSYAPDHGYVPAPSDQPKWHGPLATPVVLPSGYLADTPEVVALRGAHAASHGHGYYH